MSVDYRRLHTLWRTHEAYQSSASPTTSTSAPTTCSACYRVGPDSPIARPRRVGIAGQQLRATVALLIGWLSTAFINGWLGTPRLIRRVVVRRDEKRERMTKNLSRARRARGLIGGGAYTRKRE